MECPVFNGCARGRRALLLVPERGPARALVVELHGTGLDVRRQQSMSRLSELLLRRDVAVLLPQGAEQFQLRPDIAQGYAWNIPGAPLPDESNPRALPHDDLGWIEEVVGSVRVQLGLAEGPLFLAGYSGGARLASHLLVKGGLPWRAAGLVAGLRHIEDGTHAPPPTISFHGTEDPINPYGGSGDSRWGSGVEETGERYATDLGCLSGYREVAITGARRRSYSTQRRREALQLYAVSDASHAWPGSTDPEHLGAFGAASADLDASALIAGFFMRHLPADERRRARSRANNMRPTSPHPVSTGIVASESRGPV